MVCLGLCLPETTATAPGGHTRGVVWLLHQTEQPASGGSVRALPHHAASGSPHVRCHGVPGRAGGTRGDSLFLVPFFPPGEQPLHRRGGCQATVTRYSSRTKLSFRAWWGGDLLLWKMLLSTDALCFPSAEPGCSAGSPLSPSLPSLNHTSLRFKGKDVPFFFPALLSLQPIHNSSEQQSEESTSLNPVLAR